MKENKCLFVTVGTTLFEALIDSISDPSFLEIIASYNFHRMIIQYGKGVEPGLIQRGSNGNNDESQTSGIHETCTHGSIEWEAYRFKPTLDEDMNNADLIISHAGAGSIMEGLTKCKERNEEIENSDASNKSKKDDWKKKLVVVVNTILMNNHQSELAEALASRGYLFMIEDPRLLKETRTMQQIKDFQPKMFMGGNPASFGRMVDDLMGFS